MAQLSNDCFNPASNGSMSIEEGLALISERVRTSAEIEVVPLELADGRVLAGDVTAPLSLPGYDNSAVDGWAVRHADLHHERETVLPAVGRIAAGDPVDHELGDGEAARIFTGARMPRGADTVFMQEDVREENGQVRLPAGLAHGANRRLAGEDLALGAPALAGGTRLRPQHVALASALGFAELPVRRRLRVALLASGNELVAPGHPLGSGAHFESNRAMMRGLLGRAGCDVTDLGILGDDPETIERAILFATETHDLVLSSGGVSMGEEDHTRAVVERIGTLVQWRLAIKPGRPITMAIVGGIPFVGLPGNPVAVFVTFTQVVRGLIARLGGEDWAPAPLMQVRSAFSYRKRAGRREFVRVSIAVGADGCAEALLHPREGSGAITSLTGSTGLVELAESRTEVRPGELVGYRPYSELF